MPGWKEKSAYGKALAAFKAKKNSADKKKDHLKAFVEECTDDEDEWYETESDDDFDHTSCMFVHALGVDESHQ